MLTQIRISILLLFVFHITERSATVQSSKIALLEKRAIQNKKGIVNRTIGDNCPPGVNCAKIENESEVRCLLGSVCGRKISLKRIVEFLEGSSPCPVGNFRCQKKRSVPSKAEFLNPCHEGSLCKEKRNRSLKANLHARDDVVSKAGSTRQLGSPSNTDDDCSPGSKCFRILKQEEVWNKFLGISNGQQKTYGEAQPPNLLRVTRQCPPGLWCYSYKRTDKLALGSEILTPLKNRRQYRSRRKCTLGAWDNCVKQNYYRQCPNDMSCVSKREAGYENFETVKRCPPGLWCKRSNVGFQVDDHDAIEELDKLKERGYEYSNSKENNRIEMMQGCPTGLWCSPKRQLGYANSEAMEECPPGLWCKKNEITSQEGIWDSEEDKQNTIIKSCPIGLWCSQKRQLGYENSDTMEQCPPGLWCKKNETPGQRDTSHPAKNTLNQLIQGCPTGLWCSYKRQLGYENSDTMEQCPPGLWCKKNEITRQKDNLELTENILNGLIQGCPTGLWCNYKRQLGYENSDTIEQCPPGLWCKKNEITGQRDTSDPTENILNTLIQGCPTGLWCTYKRQLGYENSDTMEQCPRGLWCKKNEITRENDNRDVAENLMKGLMQGCPTGLWCSHKRQLGYENSDTMEQCPPGLWCKKNEITGQVDASDPIENTPNRLMQGCPTGLWCSPKRQLGYENSDTIEQCPIGLWCKKNEVTRQEDNSELIEKILNKLIQGCPTGLWCSYKRQLGYENSDTMEQCPRGLWCKKNEITRENDNRDLAENIMKGLMQGCPTGLWCSYKRHLGYENSDTMEQCPRGLWCKKNEITRENDNRDLAENIVKGLMQGCPTGLWCSYKRHLGYENSDTMEQCPRGLWCKKNEITRENDNRDLAENIVKGLMQGCPTGLWCSYKRHLGYENSDTMEQCPPGLWCKKNEITRPDTDVTENTLKGFMQGCPTGLWCSPKRQLGYENSDTMEQCPPGLWCKKNDITSQNGYMTITKSTQRMDKLKQRCQSLRGLWCLLMNLGRRRGYVNSETIYQCPPGLWCKRSENKARNFINELRRRKLVNRCPRALICSYNKEFGFESADTNDQCPPGLWCKRNEIANQPEFIPFE